MADRRQFGNLDALRGVAAVCVMFYHVLGALLPQGRLAVDFFFMLSGFVIAHSYADRLHGGMAFKDFALRRIIRLQPMIALGAALGLLCALFAIRRGVTGLSALEALGLSLQSALLIPQFRPIHGLEGVFPLNEPFWSLFFEIAANAAYALGLCRLSRGRSTLLVGASLLAVIAIGDVGGNTVGTFAAGLPRVMFGFFAGVLIHEFRCAGWFPQFRAPLAVLVATLVVVFMEPVSLAGPALVPAFAVLAAIIVFASADGGQTSHPLATALGQISYPLYTLHAPIYNFFAIGVAASALGPKAQGAIVLVAAPAVSLAAAYAAYFCVDVPSRRALTAWRASRNGSIRPAPGSALAPGS